MGRKKLPVAPEMTKGQGLGVRMQPKDQGRNSRLPSPAKGGNRAMMGDRENQGSEEGMHPTNALIFPKSIMVEAMMQRPVGMPELEDIEEEELMNVEVRDANVTDMDPPRKLGEQGNNSVHIQSNPI